MSLDRLLIHKLPAEIQHHVHTESMDKLCVCANVLRRKPNCMTQMLTTELAVLQRAVVKAMQVRNTRYDVLPPHLVAEAKVNYVDQQLHLWHRS